LLSTGCKLQEYSYIYT